MGDRILVLGADGFVEHRLTSSLLAHGERPIAVSRQPFHHDLAGAELIVADITAPEQIAPLLERTHTMVYLASRSSPGTSAGKPVEELQNNLLPFLTLLQAFQRKPQVNLFYLSSGGSLYTVDTEDPATEAGVVQPRSYHGAAKVAAEYFISAWSRQYNGHATVLRPSNLHGPGQMEKTGFGIVPACFGKFFARNRYLSGEMVPMCATISISMTSLNFASKRSETRCRSVYGYSMHPAARVRASTNCSTLLKL